jgi:hypothetical protein
MMAMSFCFMDAFRKKPIYPHPLYYHGTFLENGKFIEKKWTTVIGVANVAILSTYRVLAKSFCAFPGQHVREFCILSRLSDKPCLRAGKSVSPMSHRVGDDPAP